jgi:uncharacterized LabA/DUF88 family protein
MLDQDLKKISIVLFVDTENVTTKGFRSFVFSLQLIGEVELNVCMHSERIERGKWYGLAKELGGKVLHTKRLRKGKSCMDVYMTTQVCKRIGIERPEILVLCSGDSDFAELVKYAKSHDVHVIGYANQLGCETYEALFDQFVASTKLTGTLDPVMKKCAQTKRPYVLPEVHNRMRCL